MGFFTFTQNNSYGEMREPANSVIVEADNAHEANFIAEHSISLYFNGVEDGIDCPCCGDRWDRVSQTDMTVSPLIYGQVPEDANPTWLPSKIYYKDGKTVLIWPTVKEG